MRLQCSDADLLERLDAQTQYIVNELRGTTTAIPFLTRCNAVRALILHNAWAESDAPNPTSPHNLCACGQRSPIEVVMQRHQIGRRQVSAFKRNFLDAAYNAPGWGGEVCYAAGFLALRPTVPAKRQGKVTPAVLAALRGWAEENPFLRMSQYQSLLAIDFEEYFAESVICDALNKTLACKLKVVRRNQAERFTPEVRERARNYGFAASREDRDKFHHFDESGLCARNCGPRKGCVSTE